MSTLSTLIKQAEQEIEVQQKELARLNRQMDASLLEEARLRAEILSAFSDAQKAEDAQMLNMALHFEARQQARIEEEVAGRKKIEAEMAVVNVRMKAQFVEKKRYEILNERQIAAARAEYLKKAQAELDDLSQRRQE